MAKNVQEPEEEEDDVQESKLKRFWTKVKWWSKRIVIAYFVSTITVVILYRFINPPVTFLMIQRCFEQVFDGKDIKLNKTWVRYKYIAPQMSLAVMASEDQRFLDHSGFDFESIEKAMESNSGKGKKKKKNSIKGASTISQQVAKNVFLWPSRSWVRKGFEVYFTVLIEILWDKQRIMEVYLNVIEMGDGVYGIEAASQKYFKRSAKKISRLQAASIASILPNPRKWNPTKPTSYLKKRHRWILKNMDNLGEIKL